MNQGVTAPESDEALIASGKRDLAGFGHNRTIENFLQSGPSRQRSTTTQRYLSVLSLHMRTDNLEAPSIDQALIENRDVPRISIVRTGVSIKKQLGVTHGR